MKIEFLYKDDTYKAVIQGLIKTLDLEEKAVIYTPVAQAGLNIFSFRKNGENEETARTLDEIKTSVMEALPSKNLFIITDEISLYFSQRLYPQLADFERGLRKVLYIASLKANDDGAIKLCRGIEELEFAEIYQTLFADDNYVTEARKIVNSKSPAYSKRDMLKQLTGLSESTVWDKLFKGKYSYISENFLDVKFGRNKVMHSRSISYAEFAKTKTILSKSNKLFREIESVLLEQDNPDLEVIINTVTAAVGQFGRALFELTANKIATMLIEKFGEVAIEGIQDKAATNGADGLPVDISDEESADGEAKIVEEKKELCLTN